MHASTTTSLDAGDLTGIGFYTNKGGNGNNIRLDTIEVTAIPEPGMLALVGISMVGLLYIRRRRR